MKISAKVGKVVVVCDTVIEAPFDGVVTARNAQPGEIVSPQFLGGGGIAKVVDMDSLEVDVDVSENFINRVYSKQPATITLNAYPEVSFPAEVVAVIPTADRAKATVKVRIAFKKKDPRIVPEMGARVSFLGDAAQAQESPARCGVTFSHLMILLKVCRTYFRLLVWRVVRKTSPCTPT